MSHVIIHPATCYVCSLNMVAHAELKLWFNRGLAIFVKVFRTLDLTELDLSKAVLPPASSAKASAAEKAQRRQQLQTDTDKAKLEAAEDLKLLDELGQIIAEVGRHWVWFHLHILSTGTVDHVWFCILATAAKPAQSTGR